MDYEKHVASTIMVNRSGAILLQLRDGNTSLNPHTWCLPGGHVEPGEDSLTAARRELREETELEAGELTRFTSTVTVNTLGAVVRYDVWFGPTEARDADVACHEGAAMRFTLPDRIPELDLARPIGDFLEAFLESEQHTKVRAELGLG